MSSQADDSDNAQKRRRYIVANDENEMEQELATLGIMGQTDHEESETYQRVNEEVASEHSDVDSNPDNFCN